ncbi:hypothetical protein BLNAU_16365 [Blattamonas nauphoetae]|uniref:Uncharacterized protein n=1 Tax=Blattamonas nauphoetae TaxID=2049346 RepID=A0ABQ9X8E9_9EUKA|nr:hypothetical protein BLNAU_16365 [Blattamonas nauphoetae]
MTALNTNISSYPDSPCSDCSAFLNWSEENLETVHEKAVVLRSLVATVKLQPALDDPLEAKAVKFLETVVPNDQSLAEAFLNNPASSSDESLTEFIQSVLVLVSSPYQSIINAAVVIFTSQNRFCFPPDRLALIKADLIPQLLIILDPQSVSYAGMLDIHTCLILNISESVWLATPSGLKHLGIEDHDEQQPIHETVLKQVLIPSEQYIYHLCVNRFSIVDGKQSETFLGLLARLLAISPYYQPKMEFVLHMPVFLTIPSCLTFFENDHAIWYFLYTMNQTQLEWNRTKGTQQQIWQTVHRMLRMEGFEDVIEEKLQNDQNGSNVRWLVAFSIRWNNQQGTNLPRLF